MHNRGRVLLALLMIGLGGYLLLNELDLNLPRFDSIWPVLLLGVGVALLLGRRRDLGSSPGHVFLGTIAILVGGASLFVSLGPLTYGEVGSWWPVFAIIAGIASLAQWAATGFADREALFLSLVGLLFGGLSLAITFQLLGPETEVLLPRLWPIVLVFAGLVALFRGLLARRTR